MMTINKFYAQYFRLPSELRQISLTKWFGDKYRAISYNKKIKVEKLYSIIWYPPLSYWEQDLGIDKMFFFSIKRVPT